MLGAITHHKGVYVLLEAVKKLALKKLEFELVLAGVRKELDEIKLFLSKNNLTNFVKLIGPFSDDEKIKLYVSSDVLVLPSLWPENHSIVVIEAMASGLPVVGSRIGGIPEQIDDNKNGFLFSPGNANELAEKLKILLADNEKCKKMGNKAREKAKQEWDMIKHAKKITKIYEGLL